MVRIKVGSRQLSKGVQAYTDGVVNKVKAIVYNTARLIQSQAQALAPVDEGDLRSSIEVTLEDGGLTAVVTVGAHYAIYVEFGTGIYAVGGDGRKTPWAYKSDKTGEWVWTNGMRAQPFWFPAIEAGERYFQAEMKKLG